jgi:hypothetical protein
VRLPVAILADHALAHPIDGKLYITGGGLRRLEFAAFPATHARLSLALGIEIDAGDVGVDHQLTIVPHGPDGRPFFKPIGVTFIVGAKSTPAEQGYVHFVSNMDKVTFPEPGEYGFVIAVDGEEMGSLRLLAETRKAKEAEPAGTNEVDTLLGEGFVSFGRGDLAAAEAAFRQVTTRFPSAAGGHNNLGFVLLSKGDGASALEELSQARDLGYPQTEINAANIAAAHYSTGNAKQALDGFAACLATQVFRGPALLFGIGPEGLFPHQVSSAGEYATLMSLNAAWSAYRLGDAAAMDRYLAAASASETAQIASASSDVKASLEALSAVSGTHTAGEPPALR